MRNCIYCFHPLNGSAGEDKKCYSATVLGLVWVLGVVSVQLRFSIRSGLTEGNFNLPPEMRSQTEIIS